MAEHDGDTGSCGKNDNDGGDDDEDDDDDDIIIFSPITIKMMQVIFIKMTNARKY